MVITNHSWEEETRKYLTEVQLELNEADKQLEEVQAKRDSLAREAEIYELALQSYLKRTGRQDSIRQDIREILMEQNNHEDRIKIIAEQNNGLLNVGKSADLLYKYQILKSKSRMNAYRVVYGLMAGMVGKGIFRKSGPGEFRLVGTQPELGNVSINPKNFT